MMSMSDVTDKFIGVTSTLVSAQVVAFDIPHSEVDDHDETHLAYEILQSVAGK